MLFCSALSFRWFLVCIQSSKYLWKITIYFFHTFWRYCWKTMKIWYGYFLSIFCQYCDIWSISNCCEIWYGHFQFVIYCFALETYCIPERSIDEHSKSVAVLLPFSLHQQDISSAQAGSRHWSVVAGVVCVGELARRGQRHLVWERPSSIMVALRGR